VALSIREGTVGQRFYETMEGQERTLRADEELILALLGTVTALAEMMNMLSIRARTAESELRRVLNDPPNTTGIDGGRVTG
jgi:hypothetical protein